MFLGCPSDVLRVAEGYRDRSGEVFPIGLFHRNQGHGLNRILRVLLIAAVAASIVPVRASAPVAPDSPSVAELDALTARITDDLPLLSGLGISMIAPEPASGAVVVVADAGAEPIVRARYGDLVAVRSGSPIRPLAGPPCASGRTACPPVMRGGLELIGALLAVCTSGVEARLNQTGEIGVLTAGHCYGNIEPVTHAGIPLGVAGPGSFGGEVDAAFVTHSLGAPTFLPSNWVYYSNGDPEHRVTAVQPAASEAVGQAVCRVGRTTGVRCGSITSVNATVIIGSITLRKQRVTNICALPGDSGGPVLSGGTFRGVISAGNYVDGPNGPVCHAAPFSTYSAAQKVESALGVRVLTSSPLL